MATHQRPPTMTGARPPAFGELLRALRLAAGLTQEELAERATLSLRGISDLERGVKTRPQRETIRLLAEALALDDAARQQFEDVGRGRVSSRSSGSPAPDASSWPASLPEASRPFVGRDADLERLTALIDETSTRAVTITGPGGVGKTRLSLELAATVASRFADGVSFVSLAAVRDAALVPEAIAAALDLTPQPDTPIRETVLAALEAKAMLLVLDNFEQVTAAATFIGALLMRCPRVTLLVTSRVPLHMRGEQEYLLPPLPLPEPAPPARDMAENAAVALFVARAQEAKPDFALTDANAGAIAAICVQLDGLPLAIELAAARVRLLPPAAMTTRLASRLAVLAGGTEALPARQRTMRDAIGWSYDLLEAREQRLFRLLSTCIGGCTVEAAEALWGATDPTANVLGWIDSLADKNLLMIEEGPDDVRLIMLEVIREFAVERLTTEDDAGAARTAHASYFRGLAEQARREARGKDQLHWLNRLEREMANFRAALTWARDAGEIALALRIAAMLWRFWFTRAHFEEGQTWLESLLALDAHAGYSAPPQTRAAALNGAGHFALEVSGDYRRAAAFNREALDLWQRVGNPVREADTLDALAKVAQRQGDTTEAMLLFDRSLAKRQEAGDPWGVADTHYRRGWLRQVVGDTAGAAADFEMCLTTRRRLGDQIGIAYALLGFADVARVQGDAVRAQAMLTESLGLFNEARDRAGIASALGNLGIVADMRGDLARSRQRHEEALAIFRELGNRAEIANSLNNLGIIAVRQGDIARAGELCEQALAIYQELGDRRGIAFGLSYLGGIAEAAGETDRAAYYFTESLTMCDTLGSKAGVMDNLESLARVATTRGYAVEAARLFGAAEAIRTREKLTFSPAEEAAHDQAVGACATLIGDAAFQSALAEGLAMQLEAAVPAALSVIDTTSLAAAAQREDTLGQLARVFQRLTQGGAEREQRLQREVTKLRIEIDQAKKDRAVEEIAGSDYFRKLKEQAAALRKHAE